jgi:replicative DNA helicase
MSSADMVRDEDEYAVNETAGGVDEPVTGPVTGPDQRDAAREQVFEAARHIDRHPDTFVRWPFPALDQLAGPMGPGEVWYVCSFSGGGKTSFICSCIDRWSADGRRVYVFPLELQPWRFRTYLACMSIGIHPGEALSGNLRTLEDGQLLRGRIKMALVAQAKPPFVDTVMIDEQRAIAVAGLEKGLRKAKAFGADVVVIDHIDHVDADAQKSDFANSKLVNHALLRMAQDDDLLIVATSQLNNQVIAGQDHLARYQAPREHHVFMGGIKRQVATGMIGLYRPVRERRVDETDAQFIDLVKRARAGTVEPSRVLEPYAIGVNAMKLRNFGAREGQRTTLAFLHGRVEDMPERDRWTTSGGQPREIIR